MIKVETPGKLKAKCTRCGTKMIFTAEDAFVRYEVCGMINSGAFAREPVIYIRCATCKRRVVVTGKVSLDAVKDNPDPLCKCEGGYCHCDKDWWPV